MRESGVFRQSVEALVYLALAVILFRAFVAEGYLISTGSMAPCLLGYHRQVVCPTCSFSFSRGSHHHDERSILADGRPPLKGVDLGAEGTSPATVCPNCGLSTIDVRRVPRNEGDQLLVQKHLYQLRAPRRWEVVVFRHPKDPDQAYVKRVVGLPDETIDLVDGDVYADGKVQRKPLSVQQGMRIMVYDHDHEPTDPQWRPRWRWDDEGSRWHRAGIGFRHQPTGGAGHENVVGRWVPGSAAKRMALPTRTGPSRWSDPATPAATHVLHPPAGREDVDWLTYHHWIREGGRHRTSVLLSRWPSGVGRPESLHRRLKYAADQGTLHFEGVMTPPAAERLCRASDDPQWVAAVSQLEAASHESPIVDIYGYNHPGSSDGPMPVHDLMVEAVIAHVDGDGQFRIRLTDGWHWFETVLDFADREVRLHVDDDLHPIRSAPMPADVCLDEAVVTFSLFDRQVLVGLDGQLSLEPLVYSAEDRPRRLTSRPVQIGAAGLELFVSHLRVYRDVYYTPKQGTGWSGPSPLGPDEFFVLGDNSPVSVDSRCWEAPAIPRDLLVGKPFLVHLPSRQGRIEFAGDARHIRIPDFSRIRYIH